jgi:hypothetical protein
VTIGQEPPSPPPLLLPVPLLPPLLFVPLLLPLLFVPLLLPLLFVPLLLPLLFVPLLLPLLFVPLLLPPLLPPSSPEPTTLLELLPQAAATTSAPSAEAFKRRAREA